MRMANLLAPLLFAAASVAQAVDEGIEPPSGPPSGCETTVKGSFSIGTLDNPSLRRRETAQEAADGGLLCTLKDGILHDQYKRTGSVVANRQFQFDGPPQAGAIYTGGFSVCSNGSLAIGGSTRWWRCMSGEFGNLYDEYIGAQCHEIRIQTSVKLRASSSSLVASSATAARPSDASASTASVMTTSGSAVLSSASLAATPSPSASLSAPSGSASKSSPSPSGSATGTAAAAAPPAQAAASARYRTGAGFAVALALIGTWLLL